MSELLEVRDLHIQYGTNEGPIQAVTDVSFSVGETEFVGLVGESGSGKTTIGESILGRLAQNGEITDGEIRYKGEPIQDYTNEQFRSQIRWKEIALIPQASMNSLDPIERVDKQAIELARTHTDWSKEKTIQRLRDLFEIVGVPTERIYHYPFQFSGGMQQRAVIAMALLLEPSLIIADEPTTALDVILQDQIFKHLNSIKGEDGVSIVLITHDISVVFENCDSLIILHAGHIAERGHIDEVYTDPRHPYSILLQRAFPDIRYPRRDLAVIEGKPPRFFEDVSQCTFAERCPWAEEACLDSLPELEPIEEGAVQYTSCIRSDEMDKLKEETVTERRP